MIKVVAFTVRTRGFNQRSHLIHAAPGCPARCSIHPSDREGNRRVERSGHIAISDYIKPAAFSIIVLGVVLAVAAALEPFYDDGHVLQFGVLLSGLLPYLLYAMIVVLLPRPAVFLSGLVLLAAHALLVLSERFSGPVDYSGGVIYYVPLLLALALLPFLIVAMRQPWRG